MTQAHEDVKTQALFDRGAKRKRLEGPPVLNSGLFEGEGCQGSVTRQCAVAAGPGSVAATGTFEEVMGQLTNAGVALVTEQLLQRLAHPAVERGSPGRPYVVVEHLS